METIKNYLENMFSHLPNTPEVQKAKYELYQMMEDKYNELISEGKSDNEAIGIVISEFGVLLCILASLGPIFSECIPRSFASPDASDAIGITFCSCVSLWQSASLFFQALSHPSGAT